MELVGGSGEVRADAVCVGCWKGLGRGERFVSPAPDKPFHCACFACSRCEKIIGARTPFHFARETNRLLCKPCHQSLAPVGRPEQLEPQFLACGSCGVELKTACVARGTEGEKGLWCPRCAACRNCRLSLGQGDHALQVLDELYCSRCTDAFRLRAYNLSRLGAGLLPVLPLRPDFSHRTLRPTIVSGLPASAASDPAYAVFNFQQPPSARTQLGSQQSGSLHA